MLKEEQAKGKRHVINRNRAALIEGMADTCLYTQNNHKHCLSFIKWEGTGGGGLRQEEEGETDSSEAGRKKAAE